MRRSHCEMFELTVCNLGTGELVAQKGWSISKQIISADHSCSLTDPHGGWKNLCRLQKCNENNIVTYDWGKQNIHLVFICMSIPRIFCQLTTFFKMLKGFLKKLKKKNTGMVWHNGGAADSFLCPWVFTARKSWPTWIAKGLKSHCC